MEIFRLDFDARSMSSGEGIAQFPPEYGLMPADGVLIENWSIPSVIVSNGSALDFMPSNTLARVCSQRLVELLRKHLTVKDYVQWLPIRMQDSKEGENWNALHFAAPLPVLDNKRSKFLSTGALISPAFDPKLVENLAFFSIPREYTFAFYVNEFVMIEALRLKLRGVYFTKVDEF